MADRAAAKRFAEKFSNIHTKLQDGQVTKEQATHEAQCLYDIIRYYDFDACQMYIDKTLYVLGVTLRKGDSLLRRKSSPWVQVAQLKKALSEMGVTISHVDAFFTSVDQIENDWVSISDECLLNVFEEDGELKATLYPVKDGHVGIFDGRPVELGDGQVTKEQATHEAQLKTIDICGRNIPIATKELDLRNSQITLLPSEIGQLSQLERLDLGYNQLTKLPKEIGQLSQLKWLNLGNNQLTKLPAEIGQLEKLKFLHLNDNQLTELPEEIGQLSRLEWLNLGLNHLARLPEKIGRLSQLRWLNLCFNQLTEFPEEISQLKDLWLLKTECNPLRIRTLKSG